MPFRFMRNDVKCLTTRCAQEVYRTRREAKQQRLSTWRDACEAIRQARADAAAAAAAAEQVMAVARSQQEYNRAKDRLTAAQSEQHRAAALQVHLLRNDILRLEVQGAYGMCGCSE